MKIEQCYIGQDVAFRTKTSETESVKVVGKIIAVNIDDGVVFVESEQGQGLVPCDVLLGVL